MIIYKQYVGRWASEITEEFKQNIEIKLLPVINGLIEHLQNRGIIFSINPNTSSIISGSTLGGFRPQTTSVGAAKSNHKKGLAVDIYDPQKDIGKWCLNNESILAEFDVFVEHPNYTNNWCHFQVVPPASGRRIFIP